MKFQWYENEPFTQDLIESWSLWLADKSDRPLRIMGTMYKLEDGSYVIMERASKNASKDTPPLLLDADLTLDEAQRAAKLFLAVGETA